MLDKQKHPGTFPIRFDRKGLQVRLGRFLTVGLLNTAVTLACIGLLMRWLALDYRFANGAGYAVGFAVSFAINRTWTFGDQGPWKRSLMRWSGVVGICWGLNILLATLLHDGLGTNAYLAQLAGMVAYTACTFLGGQLLAFRAPPSSFKDTAT